MANNSNDGNILGRSFDESVRKQINQRQKTLVTNNRKTNNLYVSNTAYLRLGSSVDLTGQTQNSKVGKVLDSMGLSKYRGNSLAKALVLQGGVMNVDYNHKEGGTSYSSSMNKGIRRGNSVLNTAAYGFGGNKFGYRPMPGLESATVTSFNNGSIRKAEIKIKCFNVQQLELIDILYMKPGYSILLEWGHVNYESNEGKLKTENQVWTTPFKKFMSEQVTQQSILNVIEQEKQTKDGNYDAFYGIVSTFDYTFNSQDLTYDVTIKAITIGSVIESLKCNTAIPNNVDVNQKILAKQDLIKGKIFGWAQTLKAILDTSENEIFQQDDFDSTQTPAPEEVPDSTMILLGKKFPLYVEYWKKNLNGDYSITGDNLDNALISYFFSEQTTTEDSEGVSQDNAINNTQYYCKLMVLLDFIEKNLLLYDSTSNEEEEEEGDVVNILEDSDNDGTPDIYETDPNSTEETPFIGPENEPFGLKGGTGKPFLIIERNPNTNYCQHLPIRWSSDPTKCLVPVFLVADNPVFTNNQEQDAEDLLNNSGSTFPEINLPEVTSSFDITNTDFIPENNPYADLNVQPVVADLGSGNGLGNGVQIPVDVYEPLNLNDWAIETWVDDGNKYRLSSWVIEKIDQMKVNINKLTGQDFLTQNKNQSSIAKLMHIHINLDYACSLMASSIDKYGKINLYEYLQSLMNGINVSMGAINNFTINYDNSSNRIMIMDSAYPKYGDDFGGGDKISKFSLFESSNNSRGFMKDMRFNVELAKEHGSMMAISAQANSNQLGESATAFSQLNKGLKDRIWPNRVESDADSSELSEYQEGLLNDITQVVEMNKQFFNGEDDYPVTPTIWDILVFKLDLMYAPNLVNSEQMKKSDFDNYESGAYQQVKPEIISKGKRIIDSSTVQGLTTQTNNLFEGLFNKAGQLGQNNGRFFLPFKLHLTMHGLGGMKIFERFSITNNVLPSMYQSNNDFIITGIDHKIEGNTWDTEISANTIQKDFWKLEGVETGEINDYKSGGDTTNTQLQELDLSSFQLNGGWQLRQGDGMDIPDQWYNPETNEYQIAVWNSTTKDFDPPTEFKPIEFNVEDFNNSSDSLNTNLPDFNNSSDSLNTNLPDINLPDSTSN